MSDIGVMLSILVPAVVSEIVRCDLVSEIVATESFYRSKTYALLEQEQTGLWHFSPLTLYNIYKSEQKTGEPQLPEEV